MSKCLIANISKEMMNDLEIDYSYLSDRDLQTKMNDLVIQSNQEETKMFLSLSFVYMYDYEEEKMSKITKQLKSKGINAIFVASTPYNLSWSLKDLLDEVMQEHELFQTKARLKEVMMQFSLGENKKQAEMVLMEAFIIFQGNDVKAMNQMIEKLERLQKDLG